MEKTQPSTTNTSDVVAKLFAVGAHFGFTKRRRHPTTVPYLYGTKDGSDVIDLTKTAQQLEQATTIVAETVAAGKIVLFVGTKDEVATLVQNAAQTCEAPYVVNRWIGGMLTNFSEIKKRVKRLSDLQQENLSGDLERKYTKKERVVIGREMKKLDFNFGGIQTMERTPDLLVVVDPRYDEIAVAEARMLNIPVIGIMSSDSNASLLTYPVVMNDALQASVSYALELIVAAYQKGAASAPAERTATPAKRSVR